METPIATTAKRAICDRCQRPLRACYCSALPPTPLCTRRTRVVVVQHANEQRQRQAISSVPVLAQVLTAPTSVHVVSVSLDGSDATDVLCRTLHEQLDPVVLDDAVEAVFVLFPHEDAQTFTASLCRERAPPNGQLDSTENRKTVVLVVVDGTWNEAKKIVHHSRQYWESVASDRRARGKVFEYVCLDAADDSPGSITPPTTKSIYGELRKEPMDGCVSTLEAVAMALRVLEPESSAVCDALCSAFQGMVSIQTAFLRRGKAEQQAKHGGSPKPKSSHSTGNHTARTRDTSLPAEDQIASAASGRGVVRPYVFYTTQTDFRKRQRLVREVRWHRGIMIVSGYGGNL
jgi:DTW domain-containing protein YfiP